MSKSYEQSYWLGKGKYQAVADKLRKLVPDYGKCPADKPQLERFRVASNCYYDLFNNGLCNRDGEFTEVFGFNPQRDFSDDQGEVAFENSAMNRRLNAKLHGIILAAAKENGVEVKEQ